MVVPNSEGNYQQAQARRDSRVINFQSDPSVNSGGGMCAGLQDPVVDDDDDSILPPANPPPKHDPLDKLLRDFRKGLKDLQAALDRASVRQKYMESVAEAKKSMSPAGK